MIRIVYDTGSIDLAENSSELSQKQVILLAQLFHSGITMMKASLLAIKIIGNKNWLQFSRMPLDAKERCIDHVAWVFEEWALTRQVLPFYRRWFKKYYGPKDELINLTLSEFYFTEKFYADLVEDTTGEALNNLVAVLYRLPKYRYNVEMDLDGDIRQPFTANAIAYYSKKIAKWPKGIKLAILLFYDGCRKKLADDYPGIFKSSEKSQNEDDDMFGIIRGLAGGKYGDFEKVEQLPLHTALREIECLLEEEAKMQMELQKAG